MAICIQETIAPSSSSMRWHHQGVVAICDFDCRESLQLGPTTSLLHRVLCQKLKSQIKEVFFQEDVNFLVILLDVVGHDVLPNGTAHLSFDVEFNLTLQQPLCEGPLPHLQCQAGCLLLWKILWVARRRNWVGTAPANARKPSFKGIWQVISGH